MTTKQISLWSVITFMTAAFLSAYSILSFGIESDESLEDYQKYARDAELILIGTVESVDYKKEYFGDDGGDVYITYQYVTLNVESTIKGQIESNEIIFKGISEFIDAPQFSPGEKILVMLKWYKDDGFHGEYYAQKSSVGKFSIVEQDYPNPGETLIENERLLPEGGMKLQDFLIAIK